MPKKSVTWINYNTKRPNPAKIRMLHTHAVNERVLKALEAGAFQTIELDISSADSGKYYIGHHRLFYKNRGLVFPPHNISIAKAMKFILEHGLFTKLDCKDEKAIAKVTELAQKLGPGNCMLHAYIKEFDYQTEKREPHWKWEDIALEKIIKLPTKVNQPNLQASCRGFTYTGIATFKSPNVSNLTKVCAIAKKNKIDIVNLNLPGNQVPPNWVLQYFCDNGILLEVYEKSKKEKQLLCDVDVFTTIELK